MGSCASRLTFVLRPAVLIASLLAIAAPALCADDELKPLRVLRYRNTLNHTHRFTTDDRPAETGALSRESPPESMDSSPDFFLYPERYAFTVPVRRFRAPDGMMVFAASEEESHTLLANGLTEAGAPVYLYDR